MPPVRGVPGDLWADLVLGQPSWTEAYLRATRRDALGGHPWGCVVDRDSTPNVLYVFDAHHNRILGCNVDSIMALWTGEDEAMHYEADLVIGQPGFETSAPNGDWNRLAYPAITPASAAGLCLLIESQTSIEEGASGCHMAVHGGALWVTDNGNHRLLKFLLGGGSVSKTVSQSSDDCRRSVNNSYFDTDSGDINVGYESGGFTDWGAGFRFQNVAVPAGATIEEAYLIVTSKETQSVTVCRLRLRAQAHDSSPAFSTATEFDARVRTTAYSDWTVPTLAQDVEYQTPDFAAAVQEVVDRPGWAAGNSMAIFLENNGSDSGAFRRLYAYDAAPAKAVRLHIVYSGQPPETGCEAIDVWGQANFIDRAYAAPPTASSFRFPIGGYPYVAGVCFDSDGNMWVADAGNHRVLRFPVVEGTPAKTADLVLGQGSGAGRFSTRASGSGLNQFSCPSAVIFGDSGKLYVADFANDRVLRFTPPIADGDAGETFGSGFTLPSGFAIDPQEPGRVWINNSAHQTAELWDETSGEQIRVLGVRDNPGYLAEPTGSIGVDDDGDVFVNRDLSVIVFKRGEETELGQPIFGDRVDGALHDHHTADKIDTGLGGVVVAGEQLIVGDRGRLMFWNDRRSLKMGQACDGVCSNDGTVDDPTELPNWDQGTLCMSADRSGHLYVTADGVWWQRVHVFQLPLENGVGACAYLEPPWDLLGGGSAHAVAPLDKHHGLAAARDGSFLWVTERNNSRVLRIRNPLTDPVVDCILGQADADSYEANRGGEMGADTLSYPGALGLDRYGNLYVSDHSLEGAGNKRLLLFLASTVPTGNGSVIYGPPADKIFTAHGTLGMDFDSRNRMVVGFDAYVDESPGGGHFAAWYYDPLDPSAVVPDALLQDYNSSQYAVAFDDDDNLYVGDNNRTRFLVYYAQKAPGVRRRHRAVITDAADVVKGQITP
jgi:hypothetical protein